MKYLLIILLPIIFGCTCHDSGRIEQRINTQCIVSDAEVPPEMIAALQQRATALGCVTYNYGWVDEDFCAVGGSMYSTTLRCEPGH